MRAWRTTATLTTSAVALVGTRWPAPGGARQLANLGAMANGPAVALGGGGKLVFIGADTELILYTRSSGAVTQIASGEFTEPTVSADGSLLAFERDDSSGTTDVWTLAIDGPSGRPIGTPRQVTHGGADSPRLSADGKLIAFARDARGGQDLVVADVNGGNPHTVMHQAVGIIPVAWSPDGRWLWFVMAKNGVRTTWPVYRIAVSGGEPRQMIPFNLTSRPVLSPDGRFMLYKIATDTFAVADTAGRQLARLVLDTPSAGIVAGTPSWTARASSLVFVTVQSSRALIAVTNEGRGSTLASDSGSRTIFPAVSPDGKLVAAITSDARQSNVTIRPIGGGPVRVIHTTARPFGAPPAWSPDGRFLAVRTGSVENPAHPDATGMDIVDLASGRSRRAATADRVERIVWAPDSRSVRYVHQQSDLGGTQRPIQIRESVVGGADRLVLALTRARGRILFQSFAAVYSTLDGALTNLRTGTSTRLADAPTQDVDSGGPVLPVEVFSPDGRWMARAVSSSSGRRLQQIELISTALPERRTLQLSFTPANPRWGMVWCGDGMSLLVPGRAPDGAAHLYRVPINGDPPVPITVLDSRAAEYGFSSVPDGRLAVVTNESSARSARLMELRVALDRPVRGN